MNEVLKVIANRRSIRKYKSEQISDEELKMIIEAGLQAPSGHNDQPWFFTVIQNRELLKEISEKSKEELRKSGIEWMVKMGENSALDLLYGAPTAIAVAVKEDAISPNADEGAAIQNMLIAAESLGIGSCWIGLTASYFKEKENLKKLGIPEGYRGHYIVTLGYKEEGLNLSAPKRKNSDCIKFIK